LRSIGFFTNGPSLEGKEQNNPRHEEADQSHSYGVEKHGVQVVVDHTLDGVTALFTWSAVFAWLGKVGAGRRLTLAMKIVPPEIRPKAVSNSVGGRDGNTERGGFR
jgi:hypothetical protein